MNIIFLLRYWPIYGGGETVTLTLANKLADLGYGVTVIYLWEKTRPNMPFIDERILHKKIEGVSLPDKLHNINRSDFSLLQKYLHNYIIDNKIKIIINQWWPAKLVFNAKKETSAKLIICYHTNIRYNPIIKTFKQKIFYTLFLKDNGFVRMFRMKRKLYDSFKYSDRWVMLCYPFVMDAKHLFKKNNDKIRAIPNPLTFDDFIADADLLNKNKEILFVGRIDENKRLPYIIDAWNSIQNKKEYTDWNLTIVGNGIDFEKIKEYTKKVNCQKVWFEGYQNPLEYYKRASIFVMTSSNEGFGMVLVEAQQNGCVPVVMNSFQALHDIIQDGINGLIVPNNDIPGFVSALELLMQDDEYRLNLARKGLKTCKRFSIDSVIRQWENLFKELV